jgi:hypothetical protein
MFEVGKEYKTTDGRRAVVLEVDGPKGSIFGRISSKSEESEGRWLGRSWDCLGQDIVAASNSCNLIPEKKMVWVATWWTREHYQYLTCWFPKCSKFSSKSAALEWVGGRTLISLVEVEVPDEFSK